MPRAISTSLLAMMLLSQLTAAQERATLTVGTAKAERGRKVTGYIEVPPGSDAGMRIPVAVINGAKPGPVIAVVAGLHGTEYASILALQGLIAVLTPAQISGGVIVIPLVNVPSFEQRVAHLNPTDGKNMNRVFPGKVDGTQSERAAYLITKQVVEQCDHLIDLHGGDTDESLRPYSYWTKTGNEKQDAISREMALAFGLDHIIISTDRPKDPQDSRYLENTATTRGKPSLTAEAGYSGTTDPEDMVALMNGCLSVMRYLKILPGEPIKTENPVWIQRVESAISDQAGIFRPLVKRGTYAQQGMRIGYIADYLGNTVSEVRAPASGIVLFIRAVPSVVKGETLANIGVVITP
ncbi:MAG: M14 family metallopeptidase [Acidobacteriota bacterium]